MENELDMLERLKEMANGDETWDLSQNDRTALLWIIQKHNKMLSAITLLISLKNSIDDGEYSMSHWSDNNYEKLEQLTKE